MSSAPVLLAPIGAASVVAPNSDVIIARGAAAAGAGFVISCQGCNPLEETAATMTPRPFWYQLYWSTDEALADSMISRAEHSGAGALVHKISTSDRCRSYAARASPSTPLILDFSK
jgi:lactate 2-monooxygenase